MRIGRKLLAAIAALACIAACTPAPAPADGGHARAPASPPASPRAAPVADAGAASEAEADTGRMARLEREVEALVHTEGCTAGQCRTAPVGSRPCGGPRAYVVYCAATTDSAALFAKLAELARAEDEYNRRNGMASTCEYRMPPGVAISAGRCTATAPSSPGPQ
ncbi:hypothetical protein [Longimicrobium sp.]|uniref:hypothetical protein n=1 Tax=Longimicrobium sp. TaxID=2029185 RepID=UPI002BBEFA95|nr:hypothetical protein [Longimicrobium sp.]HSU15317.1 hypothetical protein [Longimicrobium sp.]